jgi:D-threonate/D-erythronate kinase
MNQIVIIADDLTGAADTGVQFCPYYDDTVLVSYLQLPGTKVSDSTVFPNGVTALYTNSRALAVKKAHERLKAVARRVSKSETLWIYKKIDSCLRGNPGAETEALMDELAYDASFIAPAFPEMGRTTVNGTHLVHGVPLGQTEISQDPVTPVTESDLSAIIQNQCRHPVGHIPLNFLESVETVLQDEIERQIRDGIRHIVFDATCQAHLDRIAQLIYSSYHRILPVGSAGLAAGFGDLLPSGPVDETHAERYAKDGNYLLVCGTNSEVTKRQIKTLTETYPYEEFALDPGILIDEHRRDDFLSMASSAQSKLSVKHMIITIDASQQFSASVRELHQQQAAGSMMEGLGRFLSTVLTDINPGILFLTGGDTADSVITFVGGEGIRILGEIVTGVVYGSLIGGPLERLPVVTKAGAFGRDDTLVVLHETLQGKI